MTSLLQRLPLRKIAPYVPAVRRFMPIAPVGLVLAEGRMRLVALRQHPELDWEIVQALDLPLPRDLMKDDDIQDGGGITEFVGRIFEQYGLDPDNVILGLPASYAALRASMVKRIPTEEMKAQFARNKLEQMRFDTPAHTDPVKDYARSIVPIPGAGGSELQMPVFGGLVARDKLRDLQKAVREAGITLHAIDHPGVAIYNAYRRTVKVLNTNGTGILYIGPQRLIGVEIENGGPRYIRPYDNVPGTDEALALLAQSVGGADAAEEALFRQGNTLQLYREALEPWVNNVVRLAQEIVARLANGSSNDTVTIRVCGDGAQIAGLTAILRERTGNATFEILNPLVRLAYPKSGVTLQATTFGPFVPALGLALRYLPAARGDE